MNIRSASIDDIDFSGESVSLKSGCSDAISILMLTDVASYEANISNILSTLMPFKNLSVYNLDYPSNKKVIQKHKAAIFAADDVQVPVILVFIKDILYHRISSKHITREYITNLLKNMYSNFQFKKDFISPNVCDAKYRFHSGGELQTPAAS